MTTELELYDRITEAGLSPNEYFALAFVVYGLRRPTEMILEMEKRKLQKKGFLDVNKLPTNRVREFNLFENLLSTPVPEKTKEEDEMDTKIKVFIDLFPATRLPSGQMARQGLKIVKQKFKKFFQLYAYDWEVIYQATRNYVAYYEKKEYNYMRNCAYFILKDGTSDLALECDALINMEVDRESFSTDI
jgi:hypothetical protein